MPPSQDNKGSVNNQSKYEQAMAYIAELAPRGWRLGLDRMEEFINLSDSLNQKFTKIPKFIHIAGTNGKGSTTAMVQSCLVEQGYATGAFYSPYVVEPRERIQFGRDMISEEELSQIWEYLAPMSEKLNNSEYGGVTEFEFKTAIGFEYWKRKSCEFVALEVGLGGRLDATNIVVPSSCAIVSIGWDHMHILGDTLGKIAYEKAGILKQGVPAVIGEMEDEPLNAIREFAQEIGAPLWVVGKEVTYVSEGAGIQIHTPTSSINVVPSLFGEIQYHNAAVAYAALELAGAVIDTAGVQRGFETATIPGRFQRVLVNTTEWLFDGAHNIDSGVVLRQMLEQNQKPVGFCITSMVYGHETLPFYKQFVDLIDEFVVVPIDFHRAKKVDDLASEISILGKPVSKFKSLQEGINYVMGKTCHYTRFDEKSVLVTGSFYLVGESLRVLKS